MNGVIIKDQDILGGEPVFRGTRVPFKILMEYLEGGDTLDQFLEQYPSVSRELAMASPFGRLVSLGYYDGTTSGLVQCADCDKSFHYRILAWDKQQDTRVYSLAETRNEVFDRVVAVLAPVDQPTWPSWFPALATLSETELAALSNQVDTILTPGNLPSYVIAAKSPQHSILAIRRISKSDPPTYPAFPAVSDWHHWSKYLGI